jgi:hypothetical protein
MLVRRLTAAIQGRGRRNNRSQLAEAAARASYLAVWQRVRRRTQDMTLSEARGYVRSVSMREARQQLNQLLIGYPRLDENQRRSILDRAVEHVMRMVLSQRASRSLPEFWLSRKAA